MTFAEYQQQAAKTAIYPNQGKNLTYPTLGLAGEAGEVAEKVKKLIRDHNSVISDSFRVLLCKELGDVLWYIAALCTECDLPMEVVAETNLEKLGSRQARGVLQGSGDAR